MVALPLPPDKSGCPVLHTLKWQESLLWQPKKQRTVVIQSGSDEGMDKPLSAGLVQKFPDSANLI